MTEKGEEDDSLLTAFKRILTTHKRTLDRFQTASGLEPLEPPHWPKNKLNGHISLTNQRAGLSPVFVPSLKITDEKDVMEWSTVFFLSVLCQPP